MATRFFFFSFVSLLVTPGLDAGAEHTPPACGLLPRDGESKS